MEKLLNLLGLGKLLIFFLALSLPSCPAPLLISSSSAVVSPLLHSFQIISASC